jgi:branched-chain amino acid aminotransferase
MTTSTSPGICAFVDGQFTALENAKINILDWGFLHSDATYDAVTV